MEETIDPKTTRAGGAAASGDENAYLEVVFHADLARIGERHLLGPAAHDSPAVIVGRDEPSFVIDDEARPIADPCVSRRAVAVSWNARAAAFRVSAIAESKRPIHLLTSDGAALAPPHDAVPPGTLVAIGDRVLLHLAVGPALDPPIDGMIGGSRAMAMLRREIRALASAPDSVLVYGETGVGKELVARALHDEGARRRGPFVAINCAALPEALVESELFGHARGAFSGAATAKAGLFRGASGGTLFLDEVGELPLAMQAKLLRVLQNGKVRPLGEADEVAVDVRVVLATHRDLAREVEGGRFRADLYARIEAPRIDVPPLRARKTDLPLLFVHFLAARRAEGEADAVARLWRAADAHSPPIKMTFFLDLLQHDWPRNVRELEKHAASVALATREAGQFRAPHRPAPPPEREPIAASDSAASTASASPAPPAQPAAARTPPRARPELDELLRLLDAHDYVQNRLAAALGVSRTTLDKWMRELGVRRPKDVPDAEIQAASRTALGNVTEMARILRVSIRGLKLRLKELESGD